MIEGLFALTTVFVAYVVYQIVNEPKDTNTSETPPTVQPEPPVASPAPTTEPPAAIVEQPVPDAVVEEVAAVETETTAAVEVAPAVEAVAEPSTTKPGLKNPKTGEVVLVYNNYRFAKRWVKEALVSEGLLSKIYKNNELNADVEAKIKVALAKLEAIDKYRP